MNDVYINLAPQSKQLIQSRVLQGLRTAFPKQDYGHICRELSRLYFNNLDALEGVRQAIRWSFDKYEYGTTHAFARVRTGWRWRLGATTRDAGRDN